MEVQVKMQGIFFEVLTQYPKVAFSNLDVGDMFAMQDGERWMLLVKTTPENSLYLTFNFKGQPDRPTIESILSSSKMHPQNGFYRVRMHR